jgi:DNA-binding NarL/FixJ family response regulator
MGVDVAARERGCDGRGERDADGAADLLRRVDQSGGDPRLGPEAIDAIRRVAAGERYVDPDLGAQLVVADDVPALEPLSDRERDVLHLLALGHTNQEIGKKLFISVRTVDTHRAHIMRKLQLATRAELVLFALANGLIGAT